MDEDDKSGQHQKILAGAEEDNKPAVNNNQL